MIDSIAKCPEELPIVFKRRCLSLLVLGFISGNVGLDFQDPLKI